MWWSSRATRARWPSGLVIVVWRRHAGAATTNRGESIMKQVMYAMQFKGSAAPKAGASGVIKASTTAPSCSLSSVVGPDGVTGTLLPVPGGNASFESEVTLTGETSFTEAGTSRFGDTHRSR